MADIDSNFPGPPVLLLPPSTSGDGWYGVTLLPPKFDCPTAPKVLEVDAPTYKRQIQ